MNTVKKKYASLYDLEVSSVGAGYAAASLPNLVKKIWSDLGNGRNLGRVV